ncbi:Hypothetical protein D9617_12g036200 [Elsinoe fawcettii]|nr:Hypothetical protein D9617_12g036200 [Elsinoe fawcettii]
MLKQWLSIALACHSGFSSARPNAEHPDGTSLASGVDAPQRQRDDHERILRKLQRQQPIGMRKMSDDEGEMFFLDYWTFDPLASRAGSALDSDGVKESENSTFAYLNPALSPHSSTSGSLSALRLARSIFKRDFECPVGTFACTSINQPNSCCSTGETCISVQDTGLGPVGCCPQGQNCGGSVASCNTEEGFSSCPGSPNGGCCIPGYSCQGIGCIRIGTEIFTSTTPTTTVNPATNTPGTSVQTVTTTVVISPSTSAEPTTVTQTLTISPSSTPSATPSTTASAVAPVRPTSNSNTASAPPPSTTAPPNQGCPTAFYRCSAYYVGGCCRVGRDCASTSCPVGASTTLVANSDRTIVAPAGASLGVAGNCGAGWSTCAASIGGGCCPSGYLCGVSDCTATVSGQSNVGKEAPSAATRLVGLEWVILTVALVSGVGMVLL